MSILRHEVKACLLGLLLCASFVVVTPARAAVPQLLKDALKSDSTKVRIIAIASIAKSKDPEARGLLEGLLGDKDATIRGAAVEALLLLKDPASIAALEKLKSDADANVRAVATKAIATLSAGLVFVDTGDVEDLSKSGIEGLLPLLQDGVEKAVRKELPTVAVQRGGVAKGYGLLLKIRSVKRSKDGGNSILEVKCDMTLVELPGKILRLSSSATAGAGVEGELPKNMEKELATDAINACAPSLAKDFTEYAEQRIAMMKK